MVQRQLANKYSTMTIHKIHTVMVVEILLMVCCSKLRYGVQRIRAYVNVATTQTSSQRVVGGNLEIRP